MRNLRFLLLAALLVIPFSTKANAQVAVGIGIGPAVVPAPVVYGAPPVCDWGYYPYYPYACAPYGYYGPNWFAGGVFIGAGPWYHWGWGHRYGGYGWGYRNYYRGGYGYHGGYGYRGGYAGHPGGYGGHVGGYGGGFHGGGGGFHDGGGFHGGGGGFHGGGGGFHGGGGHR